MLGSRAARIQYPSHEIGVGTRTAILCCLFALVACGGRNVVKQRPAGPVEAWGLAVYPVLFRFPVSPYQAFDRGRLVAERLSAATGRLVYGPGEFRVDDPDHDDLQRGTNVMGALKFSKSRRPEGLCGVRLTVEKRVSSGEAQVWDAGGKDKGRRRAEARIEVGVHLELLSLATHRVEAEIEGVAHVDPFSVEVDRDPFPEITRLTEQLVDTLVEVTALQRTTPPPELGLKTVVVPGPALAFVTGTQKSLKDELSALDGLDQDARMIDILRLVDPDAPRVRMRILRNAPFGLVVVDAQGKAAAAGLQVDDLVTQADGERITGRYVLDRHLSTGSVKLTVKRGGEEKELELAP